MRHSKSNGDTIVELVIAFAIFAIAAIGTLTVLNSGIATTQRNLEMTLVRQQIDSQAEIIRYLHDSKSPLWTTLIDATNITTAPASLSDTGATCPVSGTSPLNDKAFFIHSIAADPKFARKSIDPTYINDPATYAKVDGAVSEGIWIQVARAEQGPSTSVRAYDFYIHACWFGSGSDVPSTLGTIVRLYEQ